jgi:chorismate mutase/prephenate dehydrogenase
MIDTIDREVLQLLSRRDAIVSEVAGFKRSNRVAIRDHGREREIIADRRRRAEQLGLSAELVESMWRLMLWGSRDRQAGLRAEVPPDLEPRRVAIVGGQGGMGSFMARLFADLGHTVMIADIDTPLTPDEAAATADVVVISVPIEATETVIRELGPRIRPDALLTDVTSVKMGPMQAMLDSTTASVAGTHPLFGPSVHTMQGQRIVVTPGRGEQWQAWLESMLRARGLTITHATAEQHDRTMAIVQVLTHFATEVMGRTLADAGVSLEQTLQFTSPVYMMIQMSNPLRGEVTSAFVDAAAAHKKAIDGGDRDAMHAAFDTVREFFGDFTDLALEQSSFMIDRLVERT